jgi:hypothetical protein
LGTLGGPSSSFFPGERLVTNGGLASARRTRPHLIPTRQTASGIASSHIRSCGRTTC